MIVLGFIGAGIGAISISGTYPSVTSPFNLLMVLPWILVGSPFAIVVCMTVAVMFSMPLLSENVRPTFWSLIPCLLLISLATMYFLHGAPFGIQYQGRAYVLGCAIIGIGSIFLLSVTWIVARRFASYAASVAHFLVLVLWMNSYAFAYMGEAF